MTATDDLGNVSMASSRWPNVDPGESPLNSELAIVWNPMAGSRERNAAMLEELRQSGHPVTIALTESPEDAAHQTQRFLDQGCGRIAACGGDGVINLVSNALLRSRRPDISFAVLPMGTGNDYARSLGLPLSPVESAVLALKPEVLPLDVFHIRGESIDRYGVNMLAAGNTGKYTQHLTDELKQQWGPFCYLRGAIDVLQNLEVYNIDIRLDDGPWTSMGILNLFVANGRSAGAGLPIAPGAFLDDGFLDLVIVLDGSAVQLADLALHYVLADHREHELIICRRARTVEVRSDREMAWTIDGEEFLARELRIEAMPSRLGVVIGPDSPAVQAAPLL